MKFFIFIIFPATSVMERGADTTSVYRQLTNVEQPELCIMYMYSGKCKSRIRQSNRTILKVEMLFWVIYRKIIF